MKGDRKKTEKHERDNNRHVRLEHRNHKANEVKKLVKGKKEVCTECAASSLFCPTLQFPSI